MISFFFSPLACCFRGTESISSEMLLITFLSKGELSIRQQKKEKKLCDERALHLSTSFARNICCEWSSSTAFSRFFPSPSAANRRATSVKIFPNKEKHRPFYFTLPTPPDRPRREGEGNNRTESKKRLRKTRLRSIQARSNVESSLEIWIFQSFFFFLRLFFCGA